MLAATKTALGRPLCSVCLRAPVTTEAISKVNEREVRDLCASILDHYRAHREGAR